MLTMETRKAYYEVLVVLKHMDDSYSSRISPTVLKGFKDNYVKDFDFYYNPQLSLNKQKISQKALSILALLDLIYWANRRR